MRKSIKKRGHRKKTYRKNKRIKNTRRKKTRRKKIRRKKIRRKKTRRKNARRKKIRRKKTRRKKTRKMSGGGASWNNGTNRWVPGNTNSANISHQYGTLEAEALNLLGIIPVGAWGGPQGNLRYWLENHNNSGIMNMSFNEAIFNFIQEWKDDGDNDIPVRMREISNKFMQAFNLRYQDQQNFANKHLPHVRFMLIISTIGFKLRNFESHVNNLENFIDWIAEKQNKRPYTKWGLVKQNIKQMRQEVEEEYDNNNNKGEVSSDDDNNNNDTDWGARTSSDDDDNNNNDTDWDDARTSSDDDDNNDNDTDWDARTSSDDEYYDNNNNNNNNYDNKKDYGYSSSDNDETESDDEE